MHQPISAKEKRFLARARVCRISSIDEDGFPHVAPFCHAFSDLDPATRTVYVGTDETSVTARNLRARRRATIVCDDYYEDWDRIRGVVARARAKVARGAERKRAERLLKRKFAQYVPMEIDYVIALRIERITSWGL